MGGVRPDITFATVEPKLESDRGGLIDPVEFEAPATFLQSTVSQLTEVSPVSAETDGEKWKEYFLNLGIGDMLSEDALNNFNNFLKKVDKVVKTLTVVLKILRLLSSDFLNIARALKFAIKQIVRTLQDLVDTFISTGVYACVIRPDDSERDDTYFIPTWGSFEEFKAKIAAACLDQENPASPARLTKANTVGGFIIGGLAGTNDPTVVDSMISNLALLADLFGITGSYPAPPRNIRAYAGFYQKAGDGTLDKKPGVRVVWDRPDSKGVVGYRVFRCLVKEGLTFTQEQRDEALAKHPVARRKEHVRNFETARIYRVGTDEETEFEPAFVLGGIARDTYEFVDFDIEEGNTYYYSVMSVIKGDGLVDSDPWNRRVDSPLMSPSVGIKVQTCIPVSELGDAILSLDGDFIDPTQSYRFNWQSRTIRTYFGPLLDDMLDRVDEFTDQMAGLVQLAGDAMTEYIDFLSGKIRGYIKIIQVITNIVLILVNLRLRGSLLRLMLSPQAGGIENFVDRIRNSTVDSETFDALENDVTTSAGALASIKGYYFGLVTVYGYPEDPTAPGYLEQFTAPYEETYNDTKKRHQDTQKAISLLLKILLGEE